MEKKVFEVVFSRDEWVLRRRGREPMATFSTREEAIELGREKCRASRPSLLRIGKKPGTAGAA
jgi:hypothetical protein